MKQIMVTPFLKQVKMHVVISVNKEASSQGMEQP